MSNMAPVAALRFITRRRRLRFGLHESRILRRTIQSLSIQKTKQPPTWSTAIAFLLDLCPQEMNECLVVIEVLLEGLKGQQHLKTHRCRKSGPCSQFHSVGLTPGVRLDAKVGLEFTRWCVQVQGAPSEQQGPSGEPLFCVHTLRGIPGNLGMAFPPRIKPGSPGSHPVRAPREPITFQTRVACEVDRGLCCCPRRTAINGADGLRSPNPSPSPLARRLLTKKRNEGETGTEDRRNFCPKILTKQPGSLSTLPGGCGHQRHMPKGPVMQGSRPRGQRKLKLCHRVEMKPTENRKLSMREMP